jgi:hypothetical protein
MLADRQGALRWVTATNQAERAFEQVERDLGEGPCIDAFTAGQLVWTSDLRADPRWPRLGPAARTNQIRGVLSAPVVLGDQPIGTSNALTTATRDWTEADAGAVRAFAVMLGRLIGSMTDAGPAPPNASSPTSPASAGPPLRRFRTAHTGQPVPRPAPAGKRKGQDLALVGHKGPRSWHDALVPQPQPAIPASCWPWSSAPSTPSSG